MGVGRGCLKNSVTLTLGNPPPRLKYPLCGLWFTFPTHTLGESTPSSKYPLFVDFWKKFSTLTLGESTPLAITGWGEGGFLFFYVKDTEQVFHNVPKFKYSVNKSQVFGMHVRIRDLFLLFKC